MKLSADWYFDPKDRSLTVNATYFLRTSQLGLWFSLAPWEGFRAVPNFPGIGWPFLFTRVEFSLPDVVIHQS